MARYSKNNVLFVESENDKHVVKHLREHYNVPDIFEIYKCDGIENVLKKLKSELIIQDDERLERIGIMVDADTDAHTRWRDLHRVLDRSGYVNIPQSPAASGTLITQDDLPTIGVWIMPDNVIPGELEHFIEFLVPQRHTNTLWQYARKVVDEIPVRHFNEQDTMKAYIHSWLAWQKSPGRPMGWAISMKYLDANVPEARLLIDWINRLFPQ
jgi:hypothetical protein